MPTDGREPCRCRSALEPVRPIRLVVRVQVVGVRDDQLSRRASTPPLWGHGVLAGNEPEKEISLLARAIKSSTSDWAIGPSIR